MKANSASFSRASAPKSWGAGGILCFVILALTAFGKIATLISAPALLNKPHALFQVSNFWLILLATVLELSVLGAGLLGQRRTFCILTAILAVNFLCYRLLLVAFDVPEPCRCLGTFANWWPWLGRHESSVSLLLLFTLLGSSVFELRERGGDPDPTDSPVARPALNQSASRGLPRLRVAGAAAILIWVGAVSLTIQMNRNRVLGGDEGFELGKAIIAAQRPELLGRMWNDQPMFYTTLLGQVLRRTGVDLSWARWLAAIIILLFPITIVFYGAREGLPWLGLGVVAMFLLHTDALSLSASAMIEFPAYALGLASALPFIARGNDKLMYPLSGFIAATALHLKFTALFGILFSFLYLGIELSKGERLGVRLRRFVGLGGLIAALFLIGTFISPGWSWSSMISSHARTPINATVWEREMFQFKTEDFLGNPLALAFSCLGIAWAWRSRTSTIHLIWGTLLSVGIVVHSVHWPYWSYYFIHIAVPMSVLASYGVLKSISWIAGFAESAEVRADAKALAASGATIVVGLCIAWVGYRTKTIRTTLELSDQLTGSPLYSSVLKWRSQTTWMFSPIAIYPSACGLLQPPELAVLPKKRFWSGQISHEEIRQTLERYSVEQLLLPEDFIVQNDGWQSWLKQQYVLVATDGSRHHYVAKRLNPTVLDSDPQRQVLKRYAL